MYAGRRKEIGWRKWADAVEEDLARLDRDHYSAGVYVKQNQDDQTRALSKRIQELEGLLCLLLERQGLVIVHEPARTVLRVKGGPEPEAAR